MKSSESLDSHLEGPAVAGKVPVEPSWKPRSREFPVSTAIHQMVERQAALSPDATALVMGTARMSYSELNRRANRLARHLRSLGVQPDSVVAVCLERSPEMIIALLAILKAGGAYLPLDPSYPPERLQMILADAQPAILITEAYVCPSLPNRVEHVIRVDEDWTSIERQPEFDLECAAVPENLAYVIYTSGSTGKPKGVMVTHANVVRLMAATEDWFHFDSKDVWTLFHSYAFDFSVWEIWGCLMTGGRLIIVPFWLARSSNDFYKLLAEQRVTVLNQTPAAFNQLIQLEESGEFLPLNLRYVIFGGEALNFANLRPWFQRHGDSQPRLINMYGITETTVHVTYRLLTSADVEGETRSLIGEAIPDLSIYLLDEKQQPVPDDAIGEIYVGGSGVAKGYLNRPELNAERFLPDPFSTVPGARMYKSGDLARFSGKGELEYLGRGDDQVKIRGFRIELGEIEAALLQHPKVQQAVVNVWKPEVGEKKLIAYYVPRSGNSIESAELCHYLQGKLPAQMIPYSYIGMEGLPLTLNGKIDRRKLPDPQPVSPRSRELVAPHTREEELIVSILAEVLRLDSVSINDNFFDLGADSLVLAAMHSRLQKTLRREIPITDLFEFSTVCCLAERLTDSGVGEPNLQAAEDLGRRQREAYSRRKAKKGGDR
jgi:amino acid adenylation domain-containing protein